MLAGCERGQRVARRAFGMARCLHHQLEPRHGQQVVQPLHVFRLKSAARLAGIPVSMVN
jgi:hypothetical protein